MIGRRFDRLIVISSAPKHVRLRAMTQRFVLVHTEARRRAVHAVAEAPEGHEVTIRPPTRSGMQSAKFHAICGDLAKSGLEWFGKRRTPAEWKTLLVSGHAVATKEAAEIVPGIENELVSIRESTALMSKARGASLIEYATSFAVSKGVAVEKTEGVEA